VTVGSTQQIEHDSGMGSIIADNVALKGSEANMIRPILQEPTMN
jgi:hypothetical protein